MRIRNERRDVEVIRRGTGTVSRLKVGRCDKCDMNGRTSVDGKWLCAAHALEAVGGPKVR